MAYKGTLINLGDILQDRYHILFQMDSGEPGNTYLAEDVNLKNKYYVLKRIQPKSAKILAKKKAQEVFEKEVGSFCRLQHSQIPKYRELLRCEKEGKQYLFWVRDYVQGHTYQKLLDQRLEKNQKFREDEIKVLLKNLLPVLAYFHSMGMIHCNISPDNIILREEDQLPVLINFSCIKKAEKQLLSQAHSKNGVNKTISFVGTVLEMADFAPREQVDQGIAYAHSDLYALAATAVVLLTGKEPSQLVNLPQYRWNWRSEVDVNPRLEWLLDTMLASDAAERFSSAAEVIKILESISSKATEHFSSAAEVIKILESISSKRSSPTLSSTSKSATIQKILMSALQAWIKLKPFSLRQFLPRKVLLLSLLSIGLFITYAYPKHLEKLPGFSIKFPGSKKSSDAVEGNELGNSVAPKSLRDRFSIGEKILILQQSSVDKENASQAFAQGDYARAASLFSASLQSQPNDPEALIYFNNAIISEKKSHIIAVSVPIGKNVNLAKEILRGVAQAQSQVNERGGINKIPLKIQIIDDNNSIDVAQKVAKSLGDSPEILGVIGHYTSDITLATAKIYEKSGLATISPISSSVKLSGYSPNVFRTVPSDYIAARTLVQYIRDKRQKRRVAVFFDSQSDHSQSLKLEFRSSLSRLGGQVVAVFDLSDPNFDVPRSFELAVENGAEALMISTNPDKLDKALQIIQVNNQDLDLLGGDDMYTSETLQDAGQSSKSMVLAVPWHIKNNPDSDFVQMAKQLWRGKISWRTAMAYDATQAWISAIEQHQHPTRTKLQKTLANPKFSTLGTDREIKFSQSGDRLGDIQLVKIKQADNDFGYEFYPLRR